jgi:FtsH-binding integral membrane protein
MSYAMDSYITDRPVASNALPADRVTFIRRTYVHLAGAVLAFAALSAVGVRSGASMQLYQMILGGGGNLGLLLMMGAFIGGGYLAQYWAMRSTSRPLQYAGLGLYVLLQVFIFAPILTLADQSPVFADQHVIAKAGILTMAIFTGLTLTVLMTGKDFSFLGPIVGVVSFGALGLIVCAMLFGFDLGLWFSFAMVGLAAVFIIYDTSNVLHRFRTDQYVGASLQLFASVALLFFYILRIFMSDRRN